MSTAEPKTRHLRVEELRNYLVELRGADPPTRALSPRLLEDLKEDARATPEPPPGTCELKLATPVTATHIGMGPLAAGKPVRGGAHASRVSDVDADMSEAHVSAVHVDPECLNDDGDADRFVLEPTLVFRRRRRGFLVARFRRWVPRVSLVLLSVTLASYWVFAGDSEPQRSSMRVDSQTRSATQKIDASPSPVVSVAPAAETSKPTKEVRPISGPSVRAAVDFLLSGDTRAALDAYRGLATANAEASPEFALAVRLLQRELGLCAPDVEGERCAR